MEVDPTRSYPQHWMEEVSLTPGKATQIRRIREERAGTKTATDEVVKRKIRNSLLKTKW